MGGFGVSPVQQDARLDAAAPVRPIFELRPLSTGEILDRTFTLYRQRFWLYVGLSAATAAVTTLTTFVQISMGLIGRAPQLVTPTGAEAVRQGLRMGGTSLAVLVVHLLAYSITQAATVSAVEANYLGRETSIGAAFSAVLGKWLRYVGITLWQVWSFTWPLLAIVLPASIIGGVLGAAGAVGPLLVGFLVLALMIPGLVVGFLLYMRNSLGIVASVSEKLGISASMKRSKFLVADNKTRIFLLYLLLLMLALGVGTLQQFFNYFLTQSHGGMRAGVEISTLLVTFLMGALVQPVGAIAFVLFYIDQRVRKEGFDVETLLEKVTGVAPPPRLGESPFSAPLASPFSSPFGSSAAPSSSPFSTPLGTSSSSPFSSGELPGSTNADKHG